MIGEKERVVFFIKKLGVSGTPMSAKDIRLPFKMMDISLEVPYKITDGITASYLRILGNGKSFILAISKHSEALLFRILESGEIEIDTLERTKENLKSLSSYGYFFSKAMNIINERNEKYFYNFVYDLLSTIDYLNHSEYVVTKHTKDKKTGRSLKSGYVQMRIKIKHSKIKYISEEESINKHGSKHRYKYRVRGHYRNLENKTIWINDFVKGGNGTIFIPKEYEILS